MNRNIKFRAWDGKKMIQVNQLDLYNKKDVYCRINDCIDSQSEKWPLMQFTGLTDKKEKEIYEGDIVKQYGNYNQPYNTEVIFAEGKFIPLVKAEGGVGLYGYKVIDKFNNNYFEVIGNIFENPEFLK